MHIKVLDIIKELVKDLEVLDNKFEEANINSVEFSHIVEEHEATCVELNHYIKEYSVGVISVKVCEDDITPIIDEDTELPF